MRSIGGDHRAGVGRPRGPDDGAGGHAHRTHGVGDAPQPSSADADGDEEPVAGSAGPLFPGVTLALPDVLVTKMGRLVAAEFTDPHRLAALGVTRFVRFAATRGLRVRRSAADRLVAVSRRLPAPEAVVARQVLADDLVLLADLDAQIAAAEAKMAGLLPDTPFAPLITVPGWGTIRARRRGRRPAAVAGSPAVVSRLRPVPGPTRVGREAS